jgi:ligand-binding sensor domain-containing protein/two-component sensor histidine kinase
MKATLIKYSIAPKLAFFFSAFLLLCIAPLAFGQNVENLRIEKVQDEGLSSDLIECISQDNNGFLWFGTREGLFRYDGYNFKSFKNLTGDSTSLINNVVYAICPDKKKLWIGTLGGLSCMDINTQAIKNFPANESLQVSAILQKNDSVVWVGTTTGLFQFNKTKHQWKRIEALGKNVAISSICDDRKDHLYITMQNGFYSYTKSTGIWKHYLPPIPTYPRIEKNHPLSYCRSLLDGSGNLWLTTWNAGLVRFNTRTEKIKTWLHQTNDVHLVPYKVALDLLSDEYGNIWIANMEGGLTIFNPAKNKFANYPLDWKDENKLSGAVRCLFHDRSGTFWIGTGGGIYKYDPHSIQFSKTNLLYKNGNSLAQSYDAPLTMFKDGDNLLWMGMYDGLFIFDQKKGILKSYNRAIGLPQNYPVFNIIRGATGDIWLNEKNLLVKISRKSNGSYLPLQAKIYQSAEIKSNIYNIYIDHENRIWIGTHGDGIFRFDPVAEKFISSNYVERDIQSKINEIRTFCELSKDSLLIGGENTGLILLHTNNGHYEKISWPGINSLTGHTFINQIYKNKEDVWIGTEYDGLLRTNNKLKIPRLLTDNDGLPSMGIWAILADKKNNLWLLTGAGVVQFHIPDKKITVFNKKDGIKNLNELYSIIVGSNGEISVGCRGSIYNFNPTIIVKNAKPPNVLITDLKIFDKEFKIPGGKKIELDYNQNYFSFEYVALNYTQSKLNKYAYKMDGLDKKWNDAGSRRYVSYANLGEGTYVFNVKACNNEGVWNNVPAKLTLVISPPFWHRWWFYMVIAFALLSIIYIIYAYNLNQLKIRMELRDKIARDLHDDIGSTLSGISIFSKIAMQRINTDSGSSLELLEKISDRSEKTMDALSDIVWSINTRNDGMVNFLRKAREYMAEVFEAQGIRYEFSADPEMENLKIGMAARKELYLIFKEAICNASKYARCSFVKISLTGSKDTCTLSICDNGKGFDTKSISTGNGIYNMKHRAEKMNALFNIESGENTGTIVSLSFHIPRFR